MWHARPQIGRGSSHQLAEGPCGFGTLDSPLPYGILSAARGNQISCRVSYQEIEAVRENALGPDTLAWAGRRAGSLRPFVILQDSKVMPTFPPFPDESLRAICYTIGDTDTGLTGSCIGGILTSLGLDDPEPKMTKWRRLYTVLGRAQTIRGRGRCG